VGVMTVLRRVTHCIEESEWYDIPTGVEKNGS
jgi:hypothetical protein